MLLVCIKCGAKPTVNGELPFCKVCWPEEKKRRLSGITNPLVCINCECAMKHRLTDFCKPCLTRINSYVPFDGPLRRQKPNEVKTEVKAASRRKR